MNDRNNQNNNCCDSGFKEAVCIHTDKVYDSCRDKDCLENIRVYLTASGQSVVDRAINVKCTKAEIIWVFSDMELQMHNFCYSQAQKIFNIGLFVSGFFSPNSIRSTRVSIICLSIHFFSKNPFTAILISAF